MIRTLLAAALLATTAAAQTAPEPQATGGRADAIAKLMAADTDKDGAWNKAEWTAAGRRERGFSFLDADKDGLLTQAELRAGMDKLRARRAAD